MLLPAEDGRAKHGTLDGRIPGHTQLVCQCIAPDAPFGYDASMAKPRTVLPNARVQPRFAGVSTFCRFPLIEAVPPDSQPVVWALYGVPFDGGVTYLPGARFGPRAIRDAS